MKYLIPFALLLLPVQASAGQSEAKACAASLSPAALQIYQASAPHVTPTSNLRDVVYQQARGLVTSGQMSRGEARANAPAAGECLQKLQS